MARELHPFGLVPFVVAGVMLLAGCPPPPLQLDQPDATPNSPPSILGVRDNSGEEFPTGVENVSLVKGLPAGSMTVTLSDPDLEDTLYVRAFVDYDQEGNFVTPRAECEVGPPTPRSTTRVAVCQLSGVCTDGEIDGMRHVFDIMAFDREPGDGEVTPPYQKATPPGRETSDSFGLICSEAT